MANEADGISWRDRDRALYLPLLGRAKSPAAKRLVDELFDEVVRPRMAGRQMRPTRLVSHRLALEALLADLCRYRAQGRDGKHGMAAKDFPSRDLGFGLTAFALVRDALVHAGLILFKRGYKYVGVGFLGEVRRYGGDVAFFRPSSSLVTRLGNLCGLKARAHWSYGRPSEARTEPTLILRRRKVGKERPEDLPFDLKEPGVADILEGIERTNSFLRRRVDGFAFTGVRRLYNDGDVPGKRWNRGGRYYSIPGGEAYEAMGQFARLEVVRLDGETVNEVDIRASHLTVLHAVFGLPFDPGHRDPYAWGSIHREAAKAFVTTSVGKGTAQWNRWSLRARDTYAERRRGRRLEEDYTVAQVRSEGLQRYPFLCRLDEDGVNSLDLSWHEAEILTHAMGLLRDRGTSSLPVHDSLMMPSSKTEEAKSALRKAFAVHFGNELVVPALSVTYGGPGAEGLNL